MSKIDIIGEYVKDGCTLRNPQTTLLITERSQTSINKPKNFVLAVLPDGKRHYVSSLYPLTNGAYKMDYDGKTYVLTLTNEGGVIK